MANTNATVRRLAQRACELICETCSPSEIEDCVRFLLETDVSGPTRIVSTTLANGATLAYEIFNYGLDNTELRIVVTETISE
ncbi:MAG: hypothetical protein QXW98_03705 [Candidatus Caldarchaeum sp.]